MAVFASDGYGLEKMEVDMRRNILFISLLAWALLAGGCAQQPVYQSKTQSSRVYSQESRSQEELNSRAKIRADKRKINIEKMTDLLSKSKKEPLPGNWKNIVMRDIKNALKDPDSAKFSFKENPLLCAFSNTNESNYSINNSNGEPIIGYIGGCYVNAKNSYGGYTGESYWWWILSKGKVVLSFSYDQSVKTDIQGVIKRHDSEDCIVLMKKTN